MNPMDSPPADHGSDRYDYVEITAPPGIRPIGEWWDGLLMVPCLDCRANLFVKFLGADHEANRAFEQDAWHITCAHDENCPTMDTLP